MKRIAFVLAVAMSLVLITAGAGYAALNLDPNRVPNDNKSDYLPPTTPTVTESRIHGDYTANTDACASCHVAHTGVGPNLLQWASTTDACWACHNGTLGATTYNVQAGYIGNTTTRTYGGLFGDGDTVGAAVYSLSQHGVRSSLKLGAAPGGSNQSAAADANGQWTSDFSCASCHNPHGLGGNARILNPDPNGVQSITAAKSKFALTQDGVNPLKYNSGIGYWLTGYTYTPKVYVGATAGTATEVTTGFTIDRVAGTVTFASAPGNNVYADFTPALRVTMTVANKLAANETVTYLSGINAFCGACHTDYNTNRNGVTTGSATHLNGVYTEAYRHQVGMVWDDYAKASANGLKFQDNGSGTQDVVVCLTCHVAHGTNQGYWTSTLANADGGSYWNNTTAVENSGSSALKRKPNMAVCETCHQKGPLSTY